jgi:hypothetical protein
MNDSRPLDDISNHGAWVQMATGLLARFHSDFPYVNRGDTSVSKAC